MVSTLLVTRGGARIEAAFVQRQPREERLHPLRWHDVVLVAVHAQRRQPPQPPGQRAIRPRPAMIITRMLIVTPLPAPHAQGAATTVARNLLTGMSAQALASIDAFPP